jgi:hypothetical protein
MNKKVMGKWSFSSVLTVVQSFVLITFWGKLLSASVNFLNGENQYQTNLVLFWPALIF